MIIAQGKAAEAAALGKGRPTHNFSFFLPDWRASGAPVRKEKREEIILGPQPRAAPAVAGLPWAIIMSSLRDFGLARCARMVCEHSQ